MPSSLSDTNDGQRNSPFVQSSPCSSLHQTVNYQFSSRWQLTSTRDQKTLQSSFWSIKMKVATMSTTSCAGMEKLTYIRPTSSSQTTGIYLPRSPFPVARQWPLLVKRKTADDGENSAPPHAFGITRMHALMSGKVGGILSHCKHEFRTKRTFPTSPTYRMTHLNPLYLERQQKRTGSLNAMTPKSSWSKPCHRTGQREVNQRRYDPSTRVLGRCSSQSLQAP